LQKNKEVTDKESIHLNIGGQFRLYGKKTILVKKSRSDVIFFQHRARSQDGFGATLPLTTLL
jgi:hypothetical protein